MLKYLTLYQAKWSYLIIAHLQSEAILPPHDAAEPPDSQSITGGQRIPSALFYSPHSYSYLAL